MTKKQTQEDDFLCREWDLSPTGEEKKEYIEMTVKGKNTDGKFETNTLFQAKRKLDMNVKMWTQDLYQGTVGYQELLDSFGNDAYVTRLVNSIMKARLKKLAPFIGLLQRRFEEGKIKLETGLIAYASLIEYIEKQYDK